MDSRYKPAVFFVQGIIAGIILLYQFIIEKCFLYEQLIHKFAKYELIIYKIIFNKNIN